MWVKYSSLNEFARWLTVLVLFKIVRTIPLLYPHHIDSLMVFIIILVSTPCGHLISRFLIVCCPVPYSHLLHLSMASCRLALRMGHDLMRAVNRQPFFTARDDP